MKNKIICSKRWINYILLLVVIVILCLMGLSSSPLYKGIPEVDSSVFQIMGKGMLNNQTIYKDLFDHKGPIMYLINAIAYLISPRIGLFLVENILFYIGTIYVYKTATMILGEKSSVIVCLIYLMSSFNYILGGNFTEEYAITFLSIAMYYILKILYKGEYNKKSNWVIIGITFAINLFIKPTYISVWVAFGIVQLISSIKQRKIKDLIKYIGYMMISIFVIIVPIAFYLIINKNINEFIDAYIFMNMKYSNYTIMEKIKGFLNLINVFKYHIFLLLMLLVNVLIFFNKEFNKKTKGFILLFIIISLILVAWAPNLYNHYLIQLAPCVALATIFILYNIEKMMKSKKIKNKIEGLPINLIYVCIIIFIIINTINISSKQRGVLSSSSRVGNFVKLEINEIGKYIKEDDEILVLGNKSFHYILLDKQPKFKYFFQLPIIEYDKNIAKEVEKYIEEKKPKVLIKQKDITDEEFEKFYNLKTINYLKEKYEKYQLISADYYVLKEN